VFLSSFQLVPVIHSVAPTAQTSFVVMSTDAVTLVWHFRYDVNPITL
jgi:hypothetical protein